MKKGKIFGREIAAASRGDILGYCDRLMEEGGAISTVNPEILANSLKDSELQSALRQSFNVPDGVGVERALSLRGVPCQRFPGVELGEALLDRRRSTLAIIGGRGGVAQRALARLAAAHRMVTPSFAADGYSRSDEELVGLLLSHEPNLVFVCLGSPKQEIFIKRARRALPKALFVALGGSVDIYIPVIRNALRRHSGGWGANGYTERFAMGGG